MTTSKYRGHEIQFIDNVWLYSDDNKRYQKIKIDSVVIVELIIPKMAMTDALGLYQIL